MLKTKRQRSRSRSPARSRSRSPAKRGDSKDSKEDAAIDSLTETEIAEFKEAFSLFDVDGGGSISAVELGHVMSSIGQKSTPEQLQAMIDEVDVDNSGEIEFEEFLQMMIRKRQSSAALEDVKELFRFLDTNSSGDISLRELRVALEAIDNPLSDVEQADLFSFLDLDGDQRINFEEFVNMWMS